MHLTRNRYRAVGIVGGMLEKWAELLLSLLLALALLPLRPLPLDHLMVQLMQYVLDPLVIATTGFAAANDNLENLKKKKSLVGYIRASVTLCSSRGDWDTTTIPARVKQGKYR